MDPLLGENIVRRDRRSYVQRIKSAIQSISGSFYLLFLTFVALSVTGVFIDFEVIVVVLTLVAWLLAVVAHEWGHAYTAYQGGDYTIAEKGYLRLDLISFVNPIQSLVIPLLILVFGGLSLPGAAVFVNTSNLASRNWQSAVALAGPAMSFVFACLYALIHRLVLRFGTVKINSALSTFALASYFQFMGAFLNMLPLPTFDGWNAIIPYVPRDNVIVRYVNDVRWGSVITMASLVVAMVLFSFVPFFEKVPFWMTKMCGIDAFYVRRGLSEFMKIGRSAWSR